MAAQLSVLALGLSVVVCVSGVYRPPHYHTPPHTVELDTITFDKVVSQVNVTVVMFMKTHKYGQEGTEFGKFGEATSTQSQILAAVVVIDDAEQSNVELSDRFGITIKELPTVRLFVGGKLVAKLQKITNCEVLRHFVIKNTGIWVGRPGTVEYLDSLVKDFLTKTTGDEQNIILDRAREFRDRNATNDELMMSSLYYIKLFEEYIYRGPGFLGVESGRLKMLASRNKLHPPSLKGVRKEQNILQSFQSEGPVHVPHDEL